MYGSLAIAVQGYTAGTRVAETGYQTTNKSQFKKERERRKREKSKNQLFAMTIISRFSIDCCCFVSIF